MPTYHLIWKIFVLPMFGSQKFIVTKLLIFPVWMVKHRGANSCVNTIFSFFSASHVEPSQAQYIHWKYQHHPKWGWRVATKNYGLVVAKTNDKMVQGNCSPNSILHILFLDQIFISTWNLHGDVCLLHEMPWGNKKSRSTSNSKQKKGKETSVLPPSYIAPKCFRIIGIIHVCAPHNDGCVGYKHIL